MWVLFAFGSALFAGLTSILAKCGIKETDSDVATAIRTIVVLIFPGLWSGSSDLHRAFQISTQRHGSFWFSPALPQAHHGYVISALCSSET